MLTVLTALAFLGLGQERKPPGDFSFRLEYGLCTTDVLDTFQGVFVRDLGRTVPAVSIPLALSQESFDQAYRAVAAADFFSLVVGAWTATFLLSYFFAFPTADCP